MLTNDDIRAEHRLAVQTTVELVSRVTGADLDRPTPCAGWKLVDLLAHMTVQHLGFAAAAHGRGADRALWEPARVRDAVVRDPSGAYAGAAAEVLAAFSADGVLDVPFALPEFGPEAIVPGAQAIGFHFVDYVVHGWDVAESLDLPFTPAPEVVRAAAPIAFAVPDGDFRAAADSPFGPALPATDADSELDRLLRHLGRSPGWRR
ncbi:TIGR03086 family protein [Mycolicibacterium sp. S2-37]|uniref:TIGR03086 family metal-binding protein n=1 Tax=Mycolicibacterium sp. S2-37 TaxID=2810297 RepID=UPI001A93F261|nr:TIGR03086 family metal-binding protein [Mycolicibacterium sp. S2-37]MBO0677017.1 TIGR03086 family protein [Mycolicibacterium sp. S2-37]